MARLRGQRDPVLALAGGVMLLALGQEDALPAYPASWAAAVLMSQLMQVGGGRDLWRGAGAGEDLRFAGSFWGEGGRQGATSGSAICPVGVSGCWAGVAAVVLARHGMLPSWTDPGALRCVAQRLEPPRPPPCPPPLALAHTTWHAGRFAVLARPIIIIRWTLPWTLRHPPMAAVAP